MEPFRLPASREGEALPYQSNVGRHLPGLNPAPRRDLADGEDQLFVSAGQALLPLSIRRQAELDPAFLHQVDEAIIGDAAALRPRANLFSSTATGGLILR